MQESAQVSNIIAACEVPVFASDFQIVSTLVTGKPLLPHAPAPTHHKKLPNGMLTWASAYNGDDPFPFCILSNLYKLA